MLATCSRSIAPLISSLVRPTRRSITTLRVLPTTLRAFTTIGFISTVMANPISQRSNFSNMSSSSIYSNGSLPDNRDSSSVHAGVPIATARSNGTEYESFAHRNLSYCRINDDSPESESFVKTTNVSWPKVQKYIPLVPPLRENVWYKGQNGKIAVVGGSESYTGAPYFAAQASLRFGADLATVFCAREAAVPIKSYSPDLIVSPIYDRSTVEQYDQASTEEDRSRIAQEAARPVVEQLQKIHSLVIGPGMGRSAFLGAMMEAIIRHARSKKIPIVIDADALHMLSSRLPVIIGYDRCILTPNGHEIVGLVNAAIAMLEDMKQEVRASAGDVTVLFPTPAPSKVEDDGRVAEYSIDDALRDLRPPSDPVAQVRALSLALGGVAVLLKGQQDLLTAGERVFVVSDLDGTSPRRCGGQGDILAGTLGTALYWAVANLQPERVVGIERRIKSSIAVSMQRNQTGAAGGAGGSSSPSELCPDLEHVPELLRKPVLAGAVLASTVTRKAAWNAFSVHRRATTTTEILGSIGRAFEAVSPEELH